MGFVVPRRWPATICPNFCEFGRSRFHTLQNQNASGYETTVNIEARPLWGCRLSWERIEDVDAQRLQGLLDQLSECRVAIQIWDFTARGRRGSGSVVSGSNTKYRPVLWQRGSTQRGWQYFGKSIPWSGNGAARARAAVAGSLSVEVYGLASSSRIALSGDYIQIGRRLYLLTQDLVSNSGGVAMAYLDWPLLSDVATADPVLLDQAACEMIMQGEWTGSRSSGDSFTEFSAEFIETQTDFR